MQRLIGILAAGFLAASSLQAANIYLSVKPGKTTRDRDTKWHTDAGGYRKDSTQSKAIEITVRNNDRSDRTCTVEWYFVAEPIDKGNEFIYDHGSKTVALKGGEEKNLDVQSGVVRSRDINIEHANAREQFGGEYDGYLVLVHSDGKLVKTACSKRSRAYEERILALAKELREQGDKSGDDAKANDEWGGDKPRRDPPVIKRRPKKHRDKLK